MLSISTAMTDARSASHYYQNDEKEDYYLNGVGKEGIWFGGGAAHLGLGPKVTGEQFGNLLTGIDADGHRPLVQNAEKPERDCCWDFTFNAPKPVSVYWSQAPKDLRLEVERAHFDAVTTALTLAEEVGGISRRGKGGTVKERAKLLWATFIEGTSRAQDPHLHTHAVLINVGVRPDGTTGSLDTRRLFDWKVGLGAIYQAELAAKLGECLGLTTEWNKVGFAIVGVPEALSKTFSKRRARIEARMKERNLSGAVAAKIVAKDTRPKKKEVEPERLFAHWREVGEGFGWSEKEAAELARGPTEARQISHEKFSKLVRERLTALPEAKRDRKHIVVEAVRAAVEAGVGGSVLFEALLQLRTPNGQSVFWGPHPGRTEAKTEKAGENAKTADDHALVPGEAIPKEPLPAPVPQEQPSPEQETQKLPASPPASEPAEKTTQPARKPSYTGEQKAFVANARAHRLAGKKKARKRALALAKRLRPAAQRFEKRPNPHLPPRRGFVRMEWKPLFPKAPWWSPARKLRAPVVMVGARDPSWWKIRWKKDLLIGELRVQERILFRNAPQWSGLGRLTLPALRFTFKKSRFTNKTRTWERPRTRDTAKSKSKDQGHSH